MSEEDFILRDVSKPYGRPESTKESEPPSHLQHQSMYYLPLNSIEGENSDAKFFSMGISRHAKGELSVKIFRHSGKRWSRHSEEIPLDRFLKMSIFATKVLAETLNSNKQSERLKKIIKLKKNTPEKFASIQKTDFSEGVEKTFRDNLEGKMAENFLNDLKILKQELDQMAASGLLETSDDERKPGILQGKLEPGFFDPLTEEELSAWE